MDSVIRSLMEDQGYKEVEIRKMFEESLSEVQKELSKEVRKETVLKEIQEEIKKLNSKLEKEGLSNYKIIITEHKYSNVELFSDLLNSYFK